MVETGAITAQAADAAKKDQLTIKSRKAQNDYGASYFIDYAQRYIDQSFSSTGQQRAGSHLYDYGPALAARSLRSRHYRRLKNSTSYLLGLLAREGKRRKFRPRSSPLIRTQEKCWQWLAGATMMRAS